MLFGSRIQHSELTTAEVMQGHGRILSFCVQSGQIRYVDELLFGLKIRFTKFPILLRALPSRLA
jgi:hypothetical protein